MKTQKYHTVETIPISNGKIVDRENVVKKSRSVGYLQSMTVLVMLGMSVDIKENAVVFLNTLKVEKYSRC